MSVVIDGTTGVSGNNGTAATPTLRGDDPDTGVFFPSANVVAVSTGGVEQVRVASGAATIRGGLLTLGDPTFPGVFPFLSFDPGSGFTGGIEFLGDMTLYSFGPSGTYRSITMWSANTLFRDGTAAAPTIAAFSDNNTGIFFPAADTLAFAEGGVEVMRITPDARVGIGTTSPSTALHVNGTVTATTFAGSLTGTASNTTSISSAVGTGYTWTGVQYFQSNANTAASSGSAPLQAYSSSGGAIMSFHRAGQYAVNMGLDSDNVFRIGGWSAPANRLQLDMSGNLTLAGSVSATSFSSAGVGAAIAGFTTASLGAFAFCNNQSGATLAENATVAGSSLRLSDSRDASGSALSGTWRNMGRSIVTGGPATLFLRIS